MIICFEFSNGGKPHFTTSNKALFNMIKTYDIEMTSNKSFLVTGRRKKPDTITNYDFVKSILKGFILDFALMFNEYTAFSSDLKTWSNFFNTYGSKYGLKKELAQNGVI